MKDTTEHLFKSEANKQKLLESLKQFKEGQVKEHELIKTGETQCTYVIC